MEAIKKTIATVLSHNKTPLVLTVVSCTGVVITAVMAARAAPKAKKMLFELEGESPNPATFKQKTRRVWKVWVPPVAAGVVTIASIITMNRVSERNLTMVSAGALLATNALKEYQTHVLEEIGPEKESKIRDKIAKTELARTDLSDETANLFLLGGEGTLMFDGASGRYFMFSGDAEDIRRIENDLNREILNHDYVSLNEVYEEFGLEPIEHGYQVGFNTDNMLDIHFGAQLDKKKRPVLVLDFIMPPVANFNR